MAHNFQRPMDRVVRYEVAELLLRHREGDVAPFVETVVRLDGFDKSLVGLRDHGREAIVTTRGVGYTAAEEAIRSFDVRPFPGGAVRKGVVEWVDDVQWWIEEHREEFNWLHPRWRYP